MYSGTVSICCAKESCGSSEKKKWPKWTNKEKQNHIQKHTHTYIEPHTQSNDSKEDDSTGRHKRRKRENLCRTNAFNRNGSALYSLLYTNNVSRFLLCIYFRRTKNLFRLSALSARTKAFCMALWTWIQVCVCVFCYVYFLQCSWVFTVSHRQWIHIQFC